MRDSDVRKAALKMLASHHRGDASTRIVEEMGVWSGSVRVDIAVINGSLAGYEIKSDKDTLSRLPQQRDLYGKVFDTVNLIVGSRLIEKGSAMIPDWWGIYLATANDSGVELRPIRPPGLNPDLDPFLVAQLLWKEEALSVLKHLRAERGWASKRAKLVHQHLASVVPLDELRRHVRETLKSRTEWLKAKATEPALYVG